MPTPPPAPSITETFTGTTGAALSAGTWTGGYTGTGGSSATIQAGRGRWLTGSGDAYAFAEAGISRRFNLAAAADVEVTLTYQASGECFPQIYVRDSPSSLGNLDGQSGMSVSLPAPAGSGNISLAAHAGWVETPLASTACATTAGVRYAVRFQVRGSVLRAKIWPATLAEPTAWTVRAVSTAVTGAGRGGLTVAPGATAGAYVDFDDVQVTVLDGWTGGTHDSLLEMEFDTGVWTDITADVVGSTAGAITWRGGRTTRYDEVGAATLTVPLRNSDGRYTPGNAASPYAGKLLRGKRIRLTVIAPSGQSRLVFTGYTLAYAITIPDGTPASAQCEISAADLLSIMDRATLRNGLIEEARRLARTNTSGCDVFDLSATSINADPASTAPETTFANYGRLAPTVTSLGTLTVVRTAIAASAQAPGGLAASSAPTAPTADSDRDRSADTTPDNLWLERLTITPVPQSGTSGGWTAPILRYVPQAALRALELYFRIPDEFFIPSGAPFDRTIIDLWAGSTQVLRVGLGQAAGQVRVVVHSGSSVWWAAPVQDVADGIWRKLTLLHSDVNSIGLLLNDAATMSVFPTSYGLRAITAAYIGGARTSTIAGRQSRAIEGDIAGILGTTVTAGRVPISTVLGAPPPVDDVLRTYELLQYMPGSDGMVAYYSGSPTSVQQVARTPIEGRSLLDCQREVARTIGGIYYGSRTGTGVLARSDAEWRTGAPKITLTLGEDDDLAVGEIVWDDGVDSAPTRVTATWPGGQAIATDPNALPGSDRDLQISTAATWAGQAAAAAVALIPEQVILCPRRVSLDLVTTVSDKWGLLWWLLPDALIAVTGAPAAVLGASTWQVRIQGWEVTLTAETCRVTLDLDSPRAVPTAEPPPTGGGGSGSSAAPPDAVLIGSTTSTVSSFDGYRAENQLVLYTHGPTTSTPTNQWGVEWTVLWDGAAWKLSTKQDRRGTGTDSPGLTIPAGAIVLSGHGSMADYLNGLTTGTVVTLLAAGAATTWQPDPADSGGGGGGGGGTGGGSGSTNRSTLPWVNAVFSNVDNTTKFDNFQAMTGRLLDASDEHPAWVDIDGSSWWWDHHQGRGYDLIVSTPMFAPGGINTNSSTKWANAAQIMFNAGWTRTFWRPGVEFNLNTNTWYATDANWSTWAVRFNEARDAIKSKQPGARIVLCPNEGNGSGAISPANVVNLVNACNFDILAPDYYDQYEPIYTQAQADARFGNATTFGTMNWWMAKARAMGRKFGLGEWGVANGTQWAGHAGGDNAFYINYLMSWLYANRDVVEYISYFEESDPYLQSDITTTAHNPNARAAYQAKIAAYGA